MGLFDSIKLKNVSKYGYVLMGRYITNDVAFEKDIDESFSNSKKIVFLKSGLLGAKIVGNVDISDIKEFDHFKSIQTPYGITLTYNDGEKSNIVFSDNNQKLQFLKKIENLKND